MSKSIKVDDKVYERLVELTIHRETFNHVIERLLRLWDMMHNVTEILGPSHYLMGKGITDAREKETIDR